MFSFFRKKREPATNEAGVVAPANPPATSPAPAPAPAAQPAAAPASPPAARSGGLIGSALVAPMEVSAPAPTAAPERKSWMERLSAGLRKTSSNISQVFTGAPGRRTNLSVSRVIGAAQSVAAISAGGAAADARLDIHV